MSEQPTSEQSAESDRWTQMCDHIWSYQTFYLSVGNGPALEKYLCTRCLAVRWIENRAVICD